MFIIDFDDTIFNTRPGFSDARVKALAKLGISEQLYNESYQKARVDANGKVVYSNKRHAQVLGQFGSNEDKVFKALEAVCQPAKLKKFLFPDTIDFLKNIKALKEPMILLSLGEEEFQYQKIKALDLEKYFDRVFMVNDTKEHVVRAILDRITDKTIWFINDRVDQTMELHKLFPRLQTVLKESNSATKEEYQKSGLPHFATLTKIYEYIKEQSK